jgi:3-oxoacyl-[acyl-carrier protein] reductase
MRFAPCYLRITVLSLKGRGAILAGTRRLGGIVAQRLALEGVNLAIVYRRSLDEAKELQAIVARSGTEPVLIQADLSIEEDVQRAIETASNALGDVSFCVNLASDYPRTPFETLGAAAWDRGMSSAKASYLLGVHASRRMMLNTGPTRGHIVFFGDWAAQETPYHDYLPYLTGKAAIHFMTRAFAHELAPHGILANAILPGPSEKPGNVSQSEWDEAMMLAPLHRQSEPGEMAELIVTLLRMETITGETIRVDSGRHLAGAGPADGVKTE